MKVKQYKRILGAGLLCIIIMLNYIMPTASALSEQQAVSKGSDVYAAWHYINCTGYKYNMYQYTNPYRGYVEQRKDSIFWNGNLTAWRIATFNLTSEMEYAEKEKAYYEAFLFDILYDESTETFDTAYFRDVANDWGDTEKGLKKLNLSTWKKLCEYSAEVAKNTKIDLQDAETTQKLLGVIGDMEELSDALKIFGNITDVVGYCTTYSELLEKLSKLQSIINTNESVAQVVQDLYVRCNDDNIALKAALNRFAQITSGAMTREMAVKLFTDETTVEEISKAVVKEVWGKVIKECSAYSLAVEAGQKGRQIMCRYLFWNRYCYQ